MVPFLINVSIPYSPSYSFYLIQNSDGFDDLVKEASFWNEWIIRHELHVNWSH